MSHTINMLTIKRKCIIAQVILEAVDEEGNFAEEFVLPPGRILRKEEKQLSIIADRLAARLVDELNEQGRPAQMASSAYVESREVGDGAGLQAGTGDREEEPSRARQGKGRKERGAGEG
jgi:hypothetical protein